MMKKDNVLSVRINTELKHKFYDYALRNDKSVSEIINKLIDEKIKRNRKPKS
jgi:hypothetical protein